MWVLATPCAVLGAYADARVLLADDHEINRLVALELLLGTGLAGTPLPTGSRPWRKRSPAAKP
jgi:hypothetical protein